MKTEFKAKFLQHLLKKRKNEGFTLIELLVVVIIIGVLAAVALPNLLSQVGKARESEAKTAVGSINRAQQAYHFEKQTFGGASDLSTFESLIGVTVGEDYYTYTVPTGAEATAALATVLAEGTNPETDGVRPYSGRIDFSAGDYTTIVCQGDAPTTPAVAPTDATTCAANFSELQ